MYSTYIHVRMKPDRGLSGGLNGSIEEDSESNRAGDMKTGRRPLWVKGPQEGQGVGVKTQEKKQQKLILCENSVMKSSTLYGS